MCFGGHLTFEGSIKHKNVFEFPLLKRCKSFTNKIGYKNKITIIGNL